MEIKASDFPEGFVWGVATASYQIEGAVEEDGRGPSIWDTFSHTPGRTQNGETGDIAVDHYGRYVEDVGIIADLGVDAYRFSISWSRVIPDGDGKPNHAGLDFYRRLCEALIEAGVKPYATLYHWDLPQALQDRGGWLNRESVDWFARYAELVHDNIGGLIESIATFNEPWCSAFLGHSAGEHAPGITDPGASYLAAHHLMLAHHAAVERIRQADEAASLGIVLNLIPAMPATDTDEDQWVADEVDAVNNRLFLDAVFRGTYPDTILDYHRKLGVADQIDLEELERSALPVDVLGVNYYNINRFAHRPGAVLPSWPGVEDAAIVRPPGHLTEMGWGVEPEGLAWTLLRTHRDYGPVPLMVTENGAAYPDEVAEDGAIQDERRREYLESHIESVAHAISEGADVRGYFVWSLLDNFEWAKGYSKRFGIVRVDYDTMERTIKDSGHWYREFLAG